MDQAQRDLYEAELRRLEHESVELGRSWSTLPWFGVFFLSVPVAGVMYGWPLGLVAFLVTCSLIGMRMYLVGVRVAEVRWMRESLLHELAEDDQARRADGARVGGGRTPAQTSTRQGLTGYATSLSSHGR